MRLLLVFALAAFLAPGLFVTAQTSVPGRHELNNLREREATPSTTTASETFNGKNSTSPDALPIQPTVTPALGIGGFILIVAGAVLAVIGIRNLRVQVFLSTAFLTSLGVTVLIVYVMSPPVRVAVQGAYLVAVFFTGITFGALAIVFKELTEGLGCLLGGFCSSMWLLSLKPGGLLTTTDSKSGFIGAISVAFYALSFSHHTRPYGLIVSTGISGGTAVALGIDCFSRAGLKEFWLYIWGLNDNIFPLNTNTYPITRNIRVELAATVIIAILGVVSQLRLWKVVREQDNMQERKEWEARYGGAEPAAGVSELADGAKCQADEMDAMEKGDAYELKSIAETSEGSYRCSDCREREANSDAGSDVTGATEGDFDHGPAGTAKEISDKLKEESGPLPIKVFDGAAAAKIKDDKSSDMTAVIGSDTATIRSKRLSGPSCMPRTSRNDELPISQSQEALVSVDDGTSSVHGTVDEGGNLDSDCPTVHDDSGGVTEKVPESDEKRYIDDNEQQQAESKYQPQGRRSSIDKKSRVRSTQKESEEPPTAAIEEKLGNYETKGGLDAKSHTAASEMSLTMVNRQSNGSSGHDSDMVQGEEKLEGPSSTQGECLGESAVEEGRQQGDATRDTETAATDLEDHDRDKSHSGGHEKTDITDSQDQKPHAENPLPPSSQSGNGNKRVASHDKRKSPEPQPRIEPEPIKHEPPKLSEDTVRELPKRTSKVVQSYRTNEWAKHLADAEAPELEPIKPIEEEQPEYSPDAEEAAVPANVEELLQTPFNAQPPPAVEPRVQDIPSRRESRRVSSGSHMDQIKKKTPHSPPQSAQPHFSNDGYHMNPLLGSPAVLESPQDETEAAKPQWRGPPPLIAVREDMMRNRLSSFSLSMDPYSRTSPGQSPVENLQRSFSYRVHDGADDMPLSQRRAMLSQQTVMSPPPAHTPYSTSRRNHASGPSPTNTPAAMAAWRESVQEDLRDRRNPLGKQSSSMVPTGPQDRNPPAYTPSQQRPSSNHIGNAIAEGMQRGDMSDLHREAMRRMQAKANKTVKGA
ncbi:Siderophore iron transporter mirB domain protein [Aspergillus niger]|uniref:Siderophore iron transporter mirB domain protein n=1 Tax=Aspergillus niger TaxID=5061 RepID=A0A505HN29_ASPNG|nr:Siderophore iron transporter mirB domain protein [Aspergillus niger]